jgi:hypothetical protein
MGSKSGSLRYRWRQAKIGREAKRRLYGAGPLDNPSGHGKVRLRMCVGVVRVSYPGLVANGLWFMT